MRTLVFNYPAYTQVYDSRHCHYSNHHAGYYYYYYLDLRSVNEVPSLSNIFPPAKNNHHFQFVHSLGSPSSIVGYNRSQV